MTRWRGGPLAAIVTLAAAAAFSVPAGASPQAPQPQSFVGTLRFCEPACDLGTLTADGPIAGTATLEFLDDRSNPTFRVTHTTLQLTLDGDDSITLALTLHTSDDDASDPCRISFSEDGRWRVLDGTGRFADLRGGGEIHNDGVAIDHDPSCAGTPTTNIDWRLTGRVNS